MDNAALPDSADERAARDVSTMGSRLAAGAGWALAGRFSERIVGFISVACLARLLVPADFGLVAMAGSVVAFIEIFAAFGFDWALVRHPSPTREHYDAAWTMRVLLGVTTTTVLVAAGPPAAAFYRQAAVAPLLAVFGLCSLTASLENIGTVDFRRNLDFDREFWLRAIPRVAGAIFAVSVAYVFHSFWALAIGTLASRATTTALSYGLHPFRPRWSLRQGRDLLSFSVWLLVSNLVTFANNRFADLYIGRVFGARPVGVYSVANEIAHLSTTELAAPINRAVFPVYARHAHDRAEIERQFLEVASVIWMIALPVAAGIFATSREIVAILLGPQWTDSANLVRVLAIGGMLAVVVSNAQYVYLALGHSRIPAVLSAAAFGVMLALVAVLSARFGVIGVAVAYASSAALAVPLNYLLLKRVAGIRFGRLARRVWRCVVASLSMLAGLLLLAPALPTPDPLTFPSATLAFLVKVAAGGSTYAAVLTLLWLGQGRPPGPEHAAIRLLARLRRR